ncbi:MAG: Nicotinate dehydrogenase small FeS subunit [Thermoanaerobaculia bacterium]|nr:Nicotinate dehydrogenase small FeS subunit [Thermoanaerobaculia bacterium]
MARTIELELTVNGTLRRAEVHPAARLLDILRDEFRLVGTKEGCGEGECGACAVLLDGKIVNSCLVPAIQARGSEVVTVEGLAVEGQPGHLQAAFETANAAQCGFCTPGMLVAAADLLHRCDRPGETETRDALAGTLCRCTGYVKFVDAVVMAGGTRGGK